MSKPQLNLLIIPLLEQKGLTAKQRLPVPYHMSYFSFLAASKAGTILYYFFAIRWLIPFLAPNDQSCRLTVGKPKQRSQEGTGKLLSENL